VGLSESRPIQQLSGSAVNGTFSRGNWTKKKQEGKQNKPKLKKEKKKKKKKGGREKKRLWPSRKGKKD